MSILLCMQQQIAIAKVKYNNQIRIAIVGSHGVGKTTIVNKVNKVLHNMNYNIVAINEVFRDVYYDAQNKNTYVRKQAEDLTLSVYAKQLYLESLAKHNQQNILTDRSVFDVFIYNNIKIGTKHYNLAKKQAREYLNTYTKIYLIEPSSRTIEDDGFRFDTSKENQQEIHKRFIEEFKDMKNVIIINQESQQEIIAMIIKDFNYETK